MCGTLKILIANWPRTRKFSRLLQTGPREDRLDYKDRTRGTAEIEPIGKTVTFDFSHHVTCWSRSTSNFYALIGQNLTDEFVYFDSWSWQSFVSTCDVFNCLFPLNVYWVCGWEIRRLSKSEIRFRMASFSFSPCLMRKRVAKAEAILALIDTSQELHLEW